MSINTKRSRAGMITGALLAAGALVAWMLPNIAMSDNTSASEKSAKKSTNAKTTDTTTNNPPKGKKGNKRKTCLTQGCPPKARCVVLNKRAMCVFGTRKQRRDIKQNKQELAARHSAKKNKPVCMNKMCPPATRCQNVGGKAQCVPAGKLLHNPTKRHKRHTNQKGKKDRFDNPDPASCIGMDCPPKTRCIMVGGVPQCVMTGSLRPGAKHNMANTKQGMKRRKFKAMKRYNIKVIKLHKARPNRVRPAMSNRKKVKFKPRKALPDPRK